MKILIIHGSPRRGNTWKILNKVKEKINEEIDADYEIIELSKMKIPMCTGCFNCILKSEEKCPHYESIKYINDKITWCDAMIITKLVKHDGDVVGYELSNGQRVSKDEGIQMAKMGEIAGVAVATRKGNEYLRSLPDENENNNLGNLPSITD